MIAQEIEFDDDADFSPEFSTVSHQPLRRVLPVVAIVGRPNVGKSSLFNRLLRKRVAVVHDTPGVTRDRNYEICDWTGRQFYVVDTGGMAPGSDLGFDRQITEQAEVAVAESDVIVFVLDAQTPADVNDSRIARILQKTVKPVVVVANKADNDALERESHSFQRLGLGDPQPTSATGGRNLGDLLDAIVCALPAEAESRRTDTELRIAVVGRPNVGKSSLVNAMLGAERQIVSDVAGTTRDAVDSELVYQGQRYVLIDTAGLRRKMKVTEDVEFYTNLRATRALESCDVALVVVDVTDGLTTQDAKIIEQALSKRRGVALVVNKWDLQEKDSKTADRMTADLKDKLGVYRYIPILFVSALEGQRALKPLLIAREISDRANRVYGTSELQDFLEEALSRRRPPSARGKEIKIQFLAQPETNPPTFVFFSNRPQELPRSYIRFLTNRLRDRFELEGVPVRVKFKKS